MSKEELECKPTPEKDYGIYGNAALDTYCMIKSGRTDIVNVWKDVIEIQTTSNSSRIKSCPKNAFLGLCKNGYLKDIEYEQQLNNSKNAVYAINAVKYLIEKGSDSAITPIELWRELKIYKNSDRSTFKAHNGQMNVVLALWDAELIK